METLKERLSSLVAPVVDRFALDLVDLELKGSKNNMVVRAIVDTDGGVTIDTCAAVSRALADELDIADIMPGRYRLEVSSPGTDRPLRSKRDFERNLGREVRVFHRAGETIVEVEGTIQSVTDTGVEIGTAGKNHHLAWSDIEYGRLKIKW